MTKRYWMWALLLLAGCAQYQPLYQSGPSAQITHHRIMLAHLQDESVSQLGRLLSEALSHQYGPHDSPSHLLEAILKDVTVVTSPVQPGPSSLRAYSVKARLALSLKDTATRKHYRVTLREEVDFLLAGRGSQDQVLETEHNRQKALHKLADALTLRIERFIAQELATTESNDAVTGDSLQ